MSDDTWEAVEAAIRAHVHDEQGGLLTDWTLTAACVLPDADDTTGYHYAGSRHTSAHAHLGLALACYRNAKRTWDDETEDRE